MKETIYTIPINMAFEREGEECPICYLYKKLEREALDYALGAAMMEPDYREESNRVGYCNKHFGDMLKMPNKLSLSLVLDTRLNELQKEVDACTDLASKGGKKKGIFAKKDTNNEIVQRLSALNGGCMVCNKANKTIDKFFSTILYMWSRDDEFKNKFNASKGLCFNHTSMLCEKAYAELSEDKASLVSYEILKKLQQELKLTNDAIHRFTLKFDYRNRDMDISDIKDAPERAVKRTVGYTEFNAEEN